MRSRIAFCLLPFAFCLLLSALCFAENPQFDPHRDRPFHGEIKSADLTAGANFTLYEYGSDTVITLASPEKVFITEINIRCGAVTAVEVYDGSATDDQTVEAGELIHSSLAEVTVASRKENVHLSIPHLCPAGTLPKAKAGALANPTNIVIRGWIRTP